MLNLLKIGRPLGIAYVILVIYVLLALLTACGSDVSQKDRPPDLEPGTFYTVKLTPEIFGIVRIEEAGPEHATVAAYGNLFEQRPESVPRSRLHFRQDPRVGDWAREQTTLRLSMLSHMEPRPLNAR